MTSATDLTILVPLFNEAEVFPKLVERLTALMSQWSFRVELLFVDDGSTDSTRDQLRAFVADEPRARALLLARNFGQQMALSAGLEAASARAVVLLDADLQDPPELIPEFVARWKEGASVVYGIRKNRKEGFLKRACYAVFYRLLQRLSAIPIPLDAGDFCLLDRAVVDLIVALPERTRFLRGLRSWAGYRQVGIPYERAARAAGTPQYTWRKLFQLGLDGILSFSHLPLRLASVAGFLTAGLACLGLCFYLAWWWSKASIFGRRPEDAAGFMTIVMLILFFASVHLLYLGVLGEYVGRIYQEVKRRPAWIVSERLGFDPGDQPPLKSPGKNTP